MARLLFMSQQETAFNALTILKMKKSKNFHVPPLMQLVRLQLLETLIDSMYITLMQKDLNGMKFAANKLKITTRSLQLLGNSTDQELA